MRVTGGRCRHLLTEPRERPYSVLLQVNESARRRLYVPTPLPRAGDGGTGTRQDVPRRTDGRSHIDRGKLDDQSDIFQSTIYNTDSEVNKVQV